MQVLKTVAEVQAYSAKAWSSSKRLALVPTMGFLATIKAFMIVIMGGLGTIPGALVGGMIIGMIDSVVTTTISADIAIILSFVVIFFILVFRPSGLFGQDWN